ADRVEARRRRPVAARDPAPRHDGGRGGRGRGPAEPVEHAARLTGVGLVFSLRLAQRPLEGDWQRSGLARSVTRPVFCVDPPQRTTPWLKNEHPTMNPQRYQEGSNFLGAERASRIDSWFSTAWIRPIVRALCVLFSSAFTPPLPTAS